MKELMEIFKYCRVNDEKTEITGCFSIYVLREVKILYKIKVFRQFSLLKFMKILLGFCLEKNHILENEKNYLDFLLDSIYANMFGIFVWKDNNQMNNDEGQNRYENMCEGIYSMKDLKEINDSQNY